MPLDAVLERDHLAGHHAREAVDPRDAVADLEHAADLGRVTSGWNCSISRWITELISSALNFMRLSFDQSLAKLCEPAPHRGVVDVVADLDDQARRSARGRSRRAGSGVPPIIAASRSRRACNWSSSSGTAERTVDRDRRLRRSQIARASRGDRRRAGRAAVAVEHAEEPHDQARRRGPRRPRSGSGPSRPPGRAARPGSAANRGNGLRTSSSISVELVEHGVDLALLLGRVEQGLGVAAGDLGAVSSRDREPRRCAAAPARRSCRLPSVPVGAGGRQLADGGVEQAAMVVGSSSSLASTWPATETARSAVFAQISASAWSRAVAMSRSARCRAASASAWACLTICVGRRLRLLPGLVEHGPDLVGGPGHLPAVLGQQALALVAGPLGLVQDVLEVLLSRCAGPPAAASRRTGPGRTAARRRRPPSRSPGVGFGFDRVDRRLRRHALRPRPCGWPRRRRRPVLRRPWSSLAGQPAAAGRRTRRAQSARATTTATRFDCRDMDELSGRTDKSDDARPVVSIERSRARRADRSSAAGDSAAPGRISRPPLAAGRLERGLEAG